MKHFLRYFRSDAGVEDLYINSVQPVRVILNVEHQASTVSIEKVLAHNAESGHGLLAVRMNGNPYFIGVGPGTANSEWSLHIKEPEPVQPLWEVTWAGGGKRGRFTLRQQAIPDAMWTLCVVLTACEVTMDRAAYHAKKFSRLVYSVDIKQNLHDTKIELRLVGSMVEATNVIFVSINLTSGQEQPL